MWGLQEEFLHAFYDLELRNMGSLEALCLRNRRLVLQEVRTNPIKDSDEVALLIGPSFEY